VYYPAVSKGAKFLKLSEHVGTLTRGRQAGIVIVNGDPSTNIRDIENVELVFKGGVGYDSAKLIDSVRCLVGGSATVPGNYPFPPPPFLDETGRKREVAAGDAANLRWLDRAFDEAEA